MLIICILLLLSDEGIGISDEDQKHVFEAFYRSKDVKNSSIIGTGLGLSLVERLSLELDGKIFLESKIGIGTKICVTFLFKKS